MNLYIVGICGTFMAGLAKLAEQLGYQVRGCDRQCLPPMSTQLAAMGIVVDPWPDVVLDEMRSADHLILGNICARGMPVVEAIMAEGLRYTSGAGWVAEHVLADRQVLAVAGTHGKTTTSTMLTWILQQAGMRPGFLLGGVDQNLGMSADLGAGPFFVIEADEYDTAFFDKRPKFMHYRPRHAILNNLEYDHADIYPDVAAIVQQFEYLLRTIPANGQVVYPSGAVHLARCMATSFSQRVPFGALGDAGHIEARDGHRVLHWRTGEACPLPPAIMGLHNAHNALAASLLARAAGVSFAKIEQALATFTLPKRRMEYLGCWQGLHVYDDFAHHPTAMEAVLTSIQEAHPDLPITLIINLGSQTLRRTVHHAALAALGAKVSCLWVDPFAAATLLPGQAFPSEAALMAALGDHLRLPGVVVMMSSSYLPIVLDGLISQ